MCNKEVFEIKCSKCGHVGLIVGDFSDHNDCYEMHCVKCNNISYLHEQGFDAYIEGVEYEKAMAKNKDVTVLNENGVWVFERNYTKKGIRTFYCSRINKKLRKVEEYTEEVECNIPFELDFSEWINNGWEEMARIDLKELTDEYYVFLRKGDKFIRFSYDCIHKAWTQCNYRPHEYEKNVNNLVDHFILGK